MAYSETLANRIRAILVGRKDVMERKMFGGVAFMVRGHMACGIVGDELMARVGPERYDEALSMPHARPMDFTGKPLKGMVYVAPAGFRTEAALRNWVQRTTDFASSQPERASPNDRQSKARKQQRRTTR